MLLRRDMHGAITQAPMSREQLETSSLRTIYTTKKKNKAPLWELPFESGQRTPEVFVAFLYNFSSSGFAHCSNCIIRVLFWSLFPEEDLFKNQDLCDWTALLKPVNNSVYLASWIITALGSRLEFHQCNQKLAFPTCVLRLYRQGHWSE